MDNTRNNTGNNTRNNTWLIIFFIFCVILAIVGGVLIITNLPESEPEREPEPEPESEPRIIRTVGPKRPVRPVRPSPRPIGGGTDGGGSMRPSRPLRPTRPIVKHGRGKEEEEEEEEEKEKEKTIGDGIGGVIDAVIGVPNIPTENCKKRHPNEKNVFGNIDGSCWKCPDKYTKNPLNIIPTDPKACIRKSEAHIYGNIYMRSCPSVFGKGWFKDPSWSDRCWKCPASHPARTVLGKVDGNNACGKNITGIGGTTKATFKFFTRECKQFGVKSGFNFPKRYLSTTTCYGCPLKHKLRIGANPRNNKKACIAYSRATKL